MGPEESRFPYTGAERSECAGGTGQHLPEIGREVLEPFVPPGKNVGEEPVEDDILGPKPEVKE